MANRLRGAIDFPLFDGTEGFDEKTGFVLRFTTDDLVGLRDRWAPDGRKIIVDTDGTVKASYKTVIAAGIADYDPAVIVDCLKVGLKKADGKTAAPIAQATWRDLPFFVSEAAPLLDEALVWAIQGRSREAVMKELEVVRAEMEKAAAAMAGGDVGGPFASLDSFSTEQPASAKGQTLSGD